jgi:hypothetical protein
MTASIARATLLQVILLLLPALLMLRHRFLCLRICILGHHLHRRRHRHRHRHRHHQH